jgi:hypothetical protein
MADRILKTYTHHRWHIQRIEQLGKVSFEMLCPRNEHRFELPVDEDELAGLADTIRRALEGK